MKLYNNSFSTKETVNAHEVTLRAVLEIVHVFMYSYIEATESENETTRLCHSFTEDRDIHI